MNADGRIQGELRTGMGWPSPGLGHKRTDSTTFAAAYRLRDDFLFAAAAGDDDFALFLELTDHLDDFHLGLFDVL